MTIRQHAHPATGAIRGQDGRGKLLAGLAVLAVIGLAAWGIIGRRDDVANLQTLADDEAVPQVQVIHPAAGPATREIDLPGTIGAWYAAPIYAQVSGYVSKWYKDYGARVKAGDLLATIDAPSLDEQYQTAKANLAVAQTRYDLAVVTARRWKALAGTQAVSQQGVDVEVAGAAAQEALVLAAQHEVARYLAMEKFERVVAPFDGVVTSRNTDIGAYVNAGGGDSSAAGGSTELFSVADLHKMRVFVSVPQDYAGMLKPGLTATLTLPQFPGRSFDAQFKTTGNSFNQQSRTVVTELVVENPDGAIWPGTYTDVHFKTAADPNILIVPEQALLFEARGMLVAVVNADDTVTLRKVKLGLNLGQNVQVVAGLSAEDRIINDPSAGLLDGQKVHPVQGIPGIAPDAKFTAPVQHLSSAQQSKMQAARTGIDE